MNAHRQSQGFTLIELMLVIALIGVMVSFVQFAFRDDQLETELTKQAERFVALFETASEYGMLNNIELGLVIDEHQYQFVGYDGTQWSEIPDNEVLTSYPMPELVALELTLEDLPIDEQALFDATTFVNQEQEFEQQAQKKLVPQIVILSGGDISPFKVSFIPADGFEEKQIRVDVSGQYQIPLTLTGPIKDD